MVSDEYSDILHEYLMDIKQAAIRFDTLKKMGEYIYKSPDPPNLEFPLKAALDSCSSLIKSGAADAVLDVLDRNKGNIIFYGSIAEKMWLGKNLKRNPNDLNVIQYSYKPDPKAPSKVTLKLGFFELRSPTEPNTFMNEMLRALRPFYADSVRLNPRSHSLIEINRGTEWTRAIDAFEYYNPDKTVDKRFLYSKYIGFGYPTLPVFYSKEGYMLHQLKELGARKAMCCLTPHPFGPSPNPGQLHFIFDVLDIFRYKISVNKNPELSSVADEFESTIPSSVKKYFKRK